MNFPDPYPTLDHKTKLKEYCSPMSKPDASVSTVLVLGATGFLGRAISRELQEREAFNLVLAHRRAPCPADADGTDCVHVDLEDMQALREAAKGADWVVHVANYIGRDAAEMGRTNILGTGRVVQAALEARAELIYISTASVYGHGPFRGEDESQLRIAPVSTLSQSRVEAERQVLAAGGTVLRPNLTYGSGDKWFFPTLVSMIRRLNAVVDGGAGLVSVISVEILAQIVAELVSGNGSTIRGTAVNASQPDPVAIRTIVNALECDIGVQPPSANLTAPEALERAADIGLSPHQVRLLSEDNWFDSSRLWNSLPILSPTAFALTDNSRSWYKDYFSARSHENLKS
jgi:nucleoside-diphosphate-sugar epimerase